MVSHFTSNKCRYDNVKAIITTTSSSMVEAVPIATILSFISNHPQQSPSKTFLSAKLLLKQYSKGLGVSGFFFRQITHFAKPVACLYKSTCFVIFRPQQIGPLTVLLCPGLQTELTISRSTGIKSTIVLKFCFENHLRSLRLQMAYLRNHPSSLNLAHIYNPLRIKQR